MRVIQPIQQRRLSNILIDRVLLQHFQGNCTQRRLVSCSQIYKRRNSIIQGLLPARNAETPLISRLEARKVRGGRTQVVSLRFGVGQKCLSNLSANDVSSHVLRSGFAQAIAVKTRHGSGAADLQRFPQHIFCVCHGNSRF